ncbi:hypothetical protein G9C98_004866 [Cotesia typhae]|uniref:Neurotransmitter-gated ion-channel ligand-binding domain-containing protein n=1 Tax=Cotesia typhae TaxID=2053667 RepID=A0A8J5R936_9HYME|nr:hypothetical protein G9C98_004866 [Cotesia typhae]
MYKILILILSVVIENSKCFESTCKDIESKSVDLRLRRHLFCDYDPSLRPQISAHNVLNIDVNLIPKFVEFDDYTSSINFHSWLILTWDDVHLNWNPDEFDGITLHHVKSTDIWVPDFTVFNSGDLGLDQSSMPLTDCILSQNGTIQCVVSRVFTSHCPADFSDWPYDNHNCTLHFGSWLYFADELNYYFTKDSIVMDEFVRNSEWEVKLGNISKSLELYGSDVDSMIFLNIEIQRNSSRGILIYITPAIILTILTLTALYLDVCSVERTILMSTNFISHLFCIFDLHWYIPTNNAIRAPKIDKLEENNSNDTDNQNEQLKNKKTMWMECVNLIEWLVLVSVILTYVEEKSPYLRLKRHLLCDYDPSVRPTTNFRNRTDLSIVVVPKLMEFDEFTNVMKLHTWMYIAWKDHHLQWKPEEFDGVDSIYLMSHEIWTPDITIVNAGFGEEEIGIPPTTCIVSKDGRLACVPIVCFSTRCHRDHTYWPFDQQHCNVEYASWSYNTEEIYLSEDSFRMQMIHFVPNAEWKINDFKVEPVQKNLNTRRNYMWPLFL